MRPRRRRRHPCRRPRRRDHRGGCTAHAGSRTSRSHRGPIGRRRSARRRRSWSDCGRSRDVRGMMGVVPRAVTVWAVELGKDVQPDETKGTLELAGRPCSSRPTTTPGRPCGSLGLGDRQGPPSPGLSGADGGANDRFRTAPNRLLFRATATAQRDPRHHGGAAVRAGRSATQSARRAVTTLGTSA